MSGEADPPAEFDRPLTQRDLDHCPDDGNRYELIEGSLFVSPFQSYAHQQVASALTVDLGNFVRDQRLGLVLCAGLKVVLGESTAVGPDLVYISNQRMGGSRADGFYGAPDLVVEILGEKPAVDTFVKKNQYAKAGIPHYWIVDPSRRTLDAFRLEAGRHHRAASLREEDSFSPELFPGLVIPLGELWP